MDSKQNSGSKSCLTLAVIITCISILCISITLNVFYSKPLYIRGINFIHDYQQAQPYGIIIVIQNLFSFLCNKRGYGLLFLFSYFLVKRKLLMLVHISYFLVGLYFMAGLKQTFQQQRPITVDDRI